MGIITSQITITGSLIVSGSAESPGSGHVLTYDTSSGTFTYTSSAALGGGGGTVTTDGTTIDGDGSGGHPITSLIIPTGGTNAIQVDNGSALLDGNEVSTLNTKIELGVYKVLLLLQNIVKYNLKKYILAFLKF